MMRQKTYVLAKAILERKDILFGASSENVFKPQVLKEKEDAWEAVRLEMIDQGFANFERKSWRDVRNHDWQYLRRSAVAKYEHNQKLGVEPLPYSDVDKVVFEIMGNEVPSSSSQYDFINGAIAASFNFLKGEDLGLDTCNNNNNGADSFLVSPNPNASHAAESSFNTDQQQISTILNNALAASASMLNRKMSWETNSPTGSPQQQTQKGPQSNGCNLQQMPATNVGQNLNEIVDVNAEKNKVTANTNGRIICQSTPNAEFFQSLNVATASNANQGQNVVEQARPSVSSGIITSSTSQSPSRKRVHSSSSIAGRSMEEEIQETKLQLLLLQVKREELLIKQENAKLLQEEAKARQEQIKAELLERQLN